MPTQITNYQCPACTGPLHFVGESGQLECDYCGSKFDVAEIEALYAQKDEKAADAFEKAEEQRQTAPPEEETGWEAGMHTYSCPSCGAELLCDETTAATSCPYCGNPSIVPGQLSGAMKPDLILPFKLDKDTAVAALKKHYQGKFFLPKAFSAGNHIEEMQGIYVPFWLYDADAEGDCTFAATRSQTYTRGDYEITETDHFQVRRSGSVRFERIPADGSSKMQDDYMDSIEPFDYGELKPFSTAYLPGYLADKYDVSAEDCAGRAEERCKNSTVDILTRDVVGYHTVALEQANLHVKRQKPQYALMPVWTLLTKWNGKDYLFMMNGQTGKMVGDLPVSKAKFWGTFVGLAAVLTALFGVSGIGTGIGSLIRSILG